MHNHEGAELFKIQIIARDVRVYRVNLYTKRPTQALVKGAVGKNYKSDRFIDMRGVVGDLGQTG